MLRLVRDMAHAAERERVMLAHAREGDVGDHHGGAAVLRKLAGEMSRRGFAQASKHFSVGSGDSTRRVHKTFAIRVFADREENLPDRCLDPRLAEGRRA